MLKEFKTSQLLSYKKMLTDILDGVNSAINIRHKLIEYDSVSKMEYAKYDSLQDPELYYHIKLFDKAIGLVRLYETKDFFNEDPQKEKFHFAVRCYNFIPTNDRFVPMKHTINYDTYGDFETINEALRLFYFFSNELLSEVTCLPQKFLDLEIY